jgi:hypothetical protein
MQKYLLHLRKECHKPIARKSKVFTKMSETPPTKIMAQEASKQQWL